MIDGGDEYAQNNKEGPLRVHRSHSNLENKTNRRLHEEHRTRNDVGFDHSRDSAAPQRCFLFFLLLLS